MSDCSQSQNKEKCLMMFKRWKLIAQFGSRCIKPNESRKLLSTAQYKRMVNDIETILTLYQNDHSVFDRKRIKKILKTVLV